MRRPPPILTRTDTPFPYPTLSHSFVYRDGKYIDASGQSFRDFLAGRLPAMPGEKPLMGDWADHLSTLFPEVRMKRFLEMRGGDGGPWKSLRSEEHTSELQSLMRISYAVFCLKKKNKTHNEQKRQINTRPYRAT